MITSARTFAFHKAMAFIVVLVCFLVVVWIGWYVAVRSLSNSDTCWLLSMGRWIVHHGTLPKVDPFTDNISMYATVAPGTSLMQYQWLVEIIIYAMFCLGGATALRVGTSVIVCLSYLVIPSQILSRQKVPNFLILVVVIAGALISEGRFFLRPEIFGYLIFSLMIAMMIKVDSEVLSNTTRLTYLAVLTALMVIWANVHILFFVGVIFAAVRVVAIFLETMIFKEQQTTRLKMSALSLLVCLVGTCINPWGFGLWLWLLRVFHSPINVYIKENRSVIFSNPFDYLPLVLFLASIVSILVASWARLKWKGIGLLAPFIVIASGIITYAHLKFVPFAVLMTYAALADVVRRAGSDSKLLVTAADSKVATLMPNLWKLFIELNVVCQQKFCLLSRRWSLSALVIPSLTAFITSFWFLSADIPQHTAFNRAPWIAMQLLEKQCPKGVMLNFAEFGSTMSWCMKKPPRFFIDSRFSMFDPQLVLDYITMLWCNPGWETLLIKYHVDWIFMPPEAPLSKFLLRNRLWKVYYQDKGAVILIRQGNDSK